MLPLPGQSGMAFIACREAFVATTYADAHAPASGFGQNDPTLRPGQVTTMEAAIKRLRDFCAYLTAENTKLVRPDLVGRVRQNEADALLSLAYNIGPHGAYGDRPGGGLAHQASLLAALESYLVSRDAAARDLVGLWVTRANADPTTGRPFNASRRWREAILFVSGDYGDVSTLKSWGPGRDPRRDPPDRIPMPQFLT